MDCPWCRNLFTSKLRIPYLLNCGHSICRECLEQTKQRGSQLICMCCGESTNYLSGMQINFCLEEMLEAREIPCDQHPEELATHFCFSHIVSLCSVCYECHQIVYPEGDHYLVSHSETQSFDYQLREFCQTLKNDMDVHPAEQEVLKRPQKAKLRDLVMIVSDLFDPLRCMYCKEKNIKFVNLTQSVFACEHAFHKQVTDDGSAFSEWIKIEGESKEERIQFLLRLAKDLLRKIPTAVLRKEALDAYRLRLENSEARQVRDLLYYLNRDMCNAEEMRAARTFPATSQCLVCFREAAREDFFQLPCRSADHEICWDCAFKQSRQEILTCPIDNSSYAVDEVTKSRLLEVPLHRRNAKERRKEPNFVETDEGLTPNSLIVGSEVVTFTPLSPPYENLPFVQLFNHVIPEIGSRPEANLGSNTPWIVYPGVVDAIVIGTFSAVYLMGMTVSTPLVPGMQVTIESVKIYQQNEARGQPLYDLPNVGVLIGGDKVGADIWFPYALYLPYGSYALKMKLSRSEYPEVFMLYRGSPFSKPECWISSIDTSWEFTACKVLDDRELPNGHCDQSGPFLRFYFMPIE